MAWEKYKLLVVAGAALLVLGLVGSEFYQNNLERTATAASALLDSAKSDADYQKVIDTYPGSEAAANACLLLGRSKYNAKDYAGAQQAWQNLVAKFPQHPLVPTALTGVAGALEAQGKMDEARSTYQRIATEYSNSYAAPLARLGEADVLLAQRKTDDAKHIYEDLMATSQKSLAGQIAEQSLKTLNVLPAVNSGGVTPISAVTPVPASAESPTAVASLTPAPAPAEPAAAASATLMPVPVEPTPAASASVSVIPVPAAGALPAASVPITTSSVPAAQPPAPAPNPVVSPTATP